MKWIRGTGARETLERRWKMVANSTWDGIEDDKGGEGTGNVSSILEGARAETPSNEII